MKGIICLWSGAFIDIPVGWHLCDGTEDTPDLRDKFVIGAGSTYPPGSTGGSSSHVHTFESDPVNLTLDEGDEILDSSPAGAWSHVLYPSKVFGTTNSSNHLPPYYSLCYIMKL